MSVLKLGLAKGYFGLVVKTKLVVVLSGLLTILVGTNLAFFSFYQQPACLQNRTLERGNHTHLKKNTTSAINNNSMLVDLKYINLPRGTHPHMGATSPHHPNVFGVFVPDVTHLKKNPPPLLFKNEQMRQECNNRDRNYWALQRIRIAKAQQPTLPQRPIKILCGIYSIERNRKRYQAIRETWGPRCDGFFVASDQTEPDFDAVNILHAGPEEYQNMYQKIRSIWAYIYDHFYHDFDWFHLGGDDMFVMVENMRAYLESEEIVSAARGGLSEAETRGHQVPLFLGGSIAYMGNGNKLYQTGGPGYTLNKAALKMLVVEGLAKTPDSKRASYEDIIISRLFRDMSITAYRTTDEDNGVRYNHYGPATHYFGEEPAFYPNWTKPLKYNRGKNYSSVHSIAFHYVQAKNMRRFYALVYGLCNNTSS